jgi:uncharacterized protein
MRDRKTEILRWAVTITAFAALGILSPPAVGADKPLVPLEVRQVKLGGEIGRRIDVTIQNNLLQLDLDKDFLKPFREKKSPDGFIGLGMLIDSAVGLAAYSGDAKAIERKEYLVDEALKTQEPDGYLGMFRPDARLWKLWDIHEMAFIIDGLLRDHELFGEKRSLEAAKRVADYIVTRWSAEPERKPGGGEITVNMAVTGLEPVLLKLHQVTGERRYLDFCVNVRKLPEWDGQIVIGRWGPVGGHAFCHSSRCIGQLWLNEIQPNPKLLESSRRVIEFVINGDGMTINGANGYRECWHDWQDVTEHLGETCQTGYLLRLCHELVQREGKSLYGDVMERAIHNALFAAQSPDGRRLRYYVPLEGPRKYFELDSYCCPCNFRRIVSELPKLVCYRAGGGVAVNLYTPSTVKLDLDGGVSVAVRQETDYPNSGRVAIHVEPSKPAEFPVALRIPRWCAKAKVSVNGTAVGDAVTGGQFYVVRRQWSAGDRVELDMPMTWRWVKGRKAQSGRVALMRGPMLYCVRRKGNEQLKNVDLREITIVPATLEGPVPDDSVRPGGLACRVRAWSPEVWYPHVEPKIQLTLTESADPDSEQTYFKVADPHEASLVDDELINIDLK